MKHRLHRKWGSTAVLALVLACAEARAEGTDDPPPINHEQGVRLHGTGAFE